MTSVLEALTASPQTKAVIAEKLGWSVRDVEAEVQRYRLSGIPIVSNGEGYWYAQTAEEVRLCAAKLRNRAIRQMETAQGLERAAERMEQRTTLWDAA